MSDKNKIKVYYYLEETKEVIEKEVECVEDDPYTALVIAQDHEEKGINGMEGTCGGSCACATCHVIVDPEYFDKFDAPSEEEEDTLEYVCSGSSKYSRLGCQLKLTKKVDGVKFTIPNTNKL